MTELIRRRWRRMGKVQRLSVLAVFAAMCVGAMVAIVLASGPDTDGDGMSDLYESFFGLNPQNPTDAAGNPDGDSLSSLAESGVWTDPFVADTDDDGWRASLS